MLVPPSGVASNLDALGLNSRCQLGEVSGNSALREWRGDGNSGNTLAVGID